MESMRQSVPRRFTGGLGAIACMTALYLSGCAISARTTRTPAPGFRGMPISAVPRGDIIRYAESLAYASDPAVADSQPLLVPPATPGGPPTLGPWARIEAMVGTPVLTRAELAAGRIIGRITSEGTYADLGLERGVHYLWVQRYAAGAWEAYMIPRDAVRPITRLPFNVQTEPPGARMAAYRGVPRARWYYAINPGSAGWFNCDGDCCIVCSRSTRTCQHE